MNVLVINAVFSRRFRQPGRGSRAETRSVTGIVLLGATWPNFQEDPRRDAQAHTALRVRIGQHSPEGSGWKLATYEEATDREGRAVHTVTASIVREAERGGWRKAELEEALKGVPDMVRALLAKQARAMAAATTGSGPAGV